MTASTEGSDPTRFRCPLREPCLASRGPPYPSREALNAAVVEWQSLESPATGSRQAEELFGRCLPLVRKKLAGFCPASDCCPGRCLPQDMVGASFEVFQRALGDYRPGSGVNFLGVLARRLHRDLGREARRLRKHRREVTVRRVPEDRPPRETGGRNEEEDRLLDRLFVAELLGELDESDSEMLRLRYGKGRSMREVALVQGRSHAAVRKRMQRLRIRLRKRCCAAV